MLSFVRLFPTCLVPVLFVLGHSLADAQSPPLSMHRRRDAETVRKETGSPDAPGYLILTPVDPNAKLDVVANNLAATVVLPRRNSTWAESFPATIRLEQKNSVIALSHFQVDITKDQEDAIDRYLFSNGIPLEPGKRFEPLLEIRGFLVNGEPAVASVVIPTMLDLSLDQKGTDFEESSVVLRGTFIPFAVRDYIRFAENWTVEPRIEDLHQKCQVSFDSVNDKVTFHFLNRLDLSHQLSILGKNKGSLVFSFVPGNAEIRSAEGTTTLLMAPPVARQKQAKDVDNRLKFDLNIDRQREVYEVPGNLTPDETMRANALKAMPQLLTRNGGTFPGAAVNRPTGLPQKGRFSALAPSSNVEMPLYVSGGYAYAADQTGKQKSIAAFEVNFNFNEKLTAPLGFLSFGKRYSIAPAVFAKMNTTGVVNDENSFVAQVPISVKFLPGACCRGDDFGRFDMPLIRRISFYAGYLGEAARVTNKRGNGGFAEMRVFGSRMGSKDFTYRFETIFGWEVGKYRETAVNTFTAGGPDGVIKMPDGTNKVEIQKLERTGTFSRLHAGIHSTLTIGPTSSLTANFDIRQLLRKESFFDSTASAKGYFTPYEGQTVPSSFDGFDSKLAFIATGTKEAGTRRYLDIAFNQQITKFFDVRISYSRGEKAPAFQFVNKVEVAIAFKILGRDSATAR